MKPIMISNPKSREAALGHRHLKEKGTLQIGTKIPGTSTITPQTGTATQKTEKIGTVPEGPIAKAVVKISNPGGSKSPSRFEVWIFEDNHIWPPQRVFYFTKFFVFCFVQLCKKFNKNTVCLDKTLKLLVIH